LATPDVAVTGRMSLSLTFISSDWSDVAVSIGVLTFIEVESKQAGALISRISPHGMWNLVDWYIICGIVLGGAARCHMICFSVSQASLPGMANRLGRAVSTVHGRNNWDVFGTQIT
jgi:hypothetical protein